MRQELQLSFCGPNGLAQAFASWLLRHLAALEARVAELEQGLLDEADTNAKNSVACSATSRIRTTGQQRYAGWLTAHQNKPVSTPADVQTGIQAARSANKVFVAMLVFAGRHDAT